MSEHDEVELRLPARAEHLALVRLVVTHIAQTRAHLDSARLDDLRLAVSEACANAIEAYGRQGRIDGVVTIRCRAEGDRIDIDVHDEAGGFDPGALVPHPPVETPERLHHERGLGVPLMRQLADEVAFTPEGKGTTVHLTVAARRTAGRR